IIWIITGLAIGVDIDPHNQRKSDVCHTATAVSFARWGLLVAYYNTQAHIQRALDGVASMRDLVKT
ncbi:hypothetical protein, partial [Rhizobium cauense]|uniref:hypothetical protein n=1 Tax=Rhizobium cauense TaxID=1166683 RepID=UPI001C6E791C